jgi:ectoine hydroxylase-related dioxygenase (phytanoyl-CoA dioxygenase family)
VAKPVHQDNFYFDPDNTDALITAWVVIDDATMGNGCLFFAEGTHLGPSLPSRGSGGPTIQFTGVTRHRSTTPHVTGTGG